MPFLIATKVKSGTQALITGNATNQQRYTNLKSTFTPDGLYRIFAEPAESQREVSWYTDWEVDESQPILTLGQLETMDPGRAMEVRERVASMMDLFFKRIKAFEHNPPHYQRLRQVLQDSFEIPQAQDNVWLLTDTSGQERLVLTQWGHLEDTFNPERGIINRWPRHRLRDVSLQLRYRHSQQPAAHAVLYLADSTKAAGQVPTSVQTNSTGSGLLLGVLPGSAWSYYQVNEHGERINSGSLVMDERESYEIELEQWGKLQCLVEHQGVARAGETFVMEVDGHRHELVSDSHGLMELPQVKGGGRVRVYQDRGGAKINVHEFIFEPADPLVRLGMARDGETVAVVLLNQQGKAVSNGLVRLVIGDQSMDRVLDGEGSTVLEGLGAGQSVRLEYLGEGTPGKVIWQGGFIRQVGQDRYVLRMSRRWWWVWLLGILLLLGILWALYQCQGTPIIVDNRTRKPVIVDQGNQEKIQPCNASTKAGTNHISMLTYSLGKPKGKFAFTYWTGNTYADEIIIYEGADTTGHVLFRTEGKIITDTPLNRISVQLGQLDGTVVDRISPQGNEFNVLFINKTVAYNNPRGLVTVVVKPEASTDTQWEYVVNCPE